MRLFFDDGNRSGRRDSRDPDTRATIPRQFVVLPEP